MTSYIVGLRHKARSKVLTIDAEDALIAALRAKHENPEAVIPTSARPIDVAIIVTRQRRCGNRRGGDKKAYPVVVVTVVDTDEHTTEIIKA